MTAQCRKIKIENMLFQHWEDMPEPKLDFVDWFYRYGSNESPAAKINSIFTDGGTNHVSPANTV